MYDIDALKRSNRVVILQDLSMLEDLVFNGNGYPYLRKILSKGQAKRRLYALLLYFWQYGNDEPLTEEQESILSMSREGLFDKEWEYKNISFHPLRGVEIKLSQETMERNLCKDKHWDAKSWKRYVYLFMSLGLLKRHLPDQHGAEDNSLLQMGDREYAKDKKGRASTWYHVPNYETSDSVTGEPYFILSRAEYRARQLHEHKVSVSNICKDNVRDALGETDANSIFDYVSNKPYKPVQDTREIFESIVMRQLAEDGWTREDKVLSEAYVQCGIVKEGELFEDDDDSKKNISESTIKRRWNAFKSYLVSNGIKAVPPTKEDRQRWNLPDQRWIIIDVSKWRSPAS